MKGKIKKFLLLILTVLTTVFVGLFAASCGEDELGTLKSSKILYDGNYITWSKVKGAKEYVVSVNGGEPQATDNTKFKYGADEGEDEVSVSIYPVGKEEDGKPATRKFTRLETIETSSIVFSEEGKMTWNEVEGADKYLISFGTKEEAVSDTEFSKFPYNGEETKIQIRPISDDGSTFSFFSKDIYKTFLAPVEDENVKYDGETLSWVDQAYDKGYQIYIEGAPIVEDLTLTKAAKYPLEKRESFSVYIRAIGDGKDVFSSPARAANDVGKRFTWLDVIDDLVVKDGVLSWNAIEEATGYCIELSDGNNKPQIKTQKETSYELDPGKSWDIRVKPVLDDGNVIFSAYSQKKTAYVFVAPVVSWDKDLSVDGVDGANALVWSAPNAGEVGYDILVEKDGKTFDTDFVESGLYSYNNTYSDVGVYTVKVMTKAPEEDTEKFNSTWSEAITVIRLAAPTQANQDFITSDATKNANFNVKWNPVQYAVSYKIYRDKSEVMTIDHTRTYAEVSVPEGDEKGAVYAYSIKTMGKVEGKRVVLPSLEELKFDITVLATPMNVNIEAGGTIMEWEETPSASGYAITGGAGYSSETTSFDMQALPSDPGVSHSVQLSVVAKGDGAQILASNPSIPKAVCRLGIPMGLKIGTSASDEGTWIWNSITYAQSYELNVQGQKTPLTFATSGAAVENGLISTATTGTQVSVRAIADCYGTGTNSATYYLSSKPSNPQTFIKLKAPEFATVYVEGRTFKWKAPDNVNTNSGIHYRLYKTKTSTWGFSDLDANQLNLAQNTFLAGEHSFLVKAIGDGEKFINSDFSVQKNIRILPAPTVTVAEGSTEFEWTHVNRATAYDVKINGKVVANEEYKGVAQTYKYNPEGQLKQITDAAYEVEFISKGTDGYNEVDGWTTIDSWPTVFKTSVKKANNPQKVEYEYRVNGVKSDFASDSGGEIYINVTPAQKDNANGYQYFINNTSSKRNTGTEYTSETASLGATNEYKIVVVACGGKFGEVKQDTNPITGLPIEGSFSAVFYIDSDSKSADEELIILGKPGNIQTSDYGLEWKDTEGANKGYLIKLYYGEQIITIKSSSAYIDFNSQYDYADGSGKFTFETLQGLDKVEVYANGDGKTVIGSVASVRTTF